MSVKLFEVVILYMIMFVTYFLRKAAKIPILVEHFHVVQKSRKGQISKCYRIGCENTIYLVKKC